METGRNVMHYALGDNQDYEHEWSKAVLEYLENGYSSEDSKSEVEVGNTTYKILKREKVTAFYDADGNTLFDIENDRLKEEYEAMESLDETEPKSEIGRAIAGIEKQAFEQAVDNNIGTDEMIPMGTASLEEIAKGIPAPTPEEVETAKKNNSSVYIGVVGAVTKLQEELKKAKDKSFADPIIKHLIERCRESESLACMESILYPGNLPQAWEHTPMKYSALEILAQNIPTTAFRYEDALDVYLKFPKLEWLCKMGLNQLAKDVVRGYNYSGNMTGKVNYKADTIYEILGLNKVNTRTLQAIDGNHYELRLLQVAQQLDIQMKPEQLKEFYETFECNTDLLKEKNRRVSLHKLCRYIDKESERYPIGEKNACMWGYSYNRYKERTDPRIERKQNMAHDWLEYIGWCRELKYDLDNKFIYMPNNFKKVHDRTAEEYKALQDKKAAAEKKRREKLAAKKMAETKKAMEEIFSRNDGVDAFQIKGKGLILVVPQSGDEIRKEGEALHHCVGGYVDRVARGETNIFFIRKADHPEKSYFTMEWRNNKIIQCRGFKNCGMPADVQAFVKVFEKKMNEAIQGDNKKNAKRKAG